MQDIKLGALNLITFMVSFSNIEQWLKLTSTFSIYCVHNYENY